jgi:hypothetical protein
MKSHSTNYFNTFIEVAPDCPVLEAETPIAKNDKPTVASMQFDMVVNNPYKYTSDDIIFQVFADRKDITESEREEARQQFFSKGQPCLRASPLTKRYGWGVHSNAEGKVAIYNMNTDEYEKFVNDDSIAKVKAMKSKR